MGIVALTAWEEFVVPRFNLDPSLPANRLRLTKRERDIEWITPLTADAPVPLPTMEMLEERQRRSTLGRGAAYPNTLRQKRTVPSSREPVRYTEEWSEYYDADVYIFKEKNECTKTIFLGRASINALHRDSRRNILRSVEGPSNPQLWKPWVLGRVPRSSAPFATRMIDERAYDGYDVRQLLREGSPPNAIDFGCGVGMSTCPDGIGVDASR